MYVYWLIYDSMLINIQSKLYEIKNYVSTQYLRSDTELFDIFEPSYIRPALENGSKEFLLGSLIFGATKWMELTADFELPVVNVSINPLTSINKQIWSVLRAFPDNFIATNNANLYRNKIVWCITGQQQTSMLFKHIVRNTKKDVIQYHSSTSHEDLEDLGLSCSDDYILSGYSVPNTEDRSNNNDDEDMANLIQPQLLSSSGQLYWYRSKSPSHKSNFSMHSSAKSNQGEESDDNNNKELSRVKQRKVHITADREVAEQGKDVMYDSRPIKH
ncbi:hypothetical protein B0H34DRAFT_676899 [Crassisporium funariophilum]|nr:hypothetical protein B0H34DRAFT_676899 [Crassisporium funariophilum]